jgi:hypothetical protein
MYEVTKFQDPRGRWCIRYRKGDYVGTYTAMDEDDADAFAESHERQEADRRFAVLKLTTRLPTRE